MLTTRGGLGFGRCEFSGGKLKRTSMQAATILIKGRIVIGRIAWDSDVRKFGTKQSSYVRVNC